MSDNNNNQYDSSFIDDFILQSHSDEFGTSKNLNKKDIDISFPELNGTTIARIDVEKSDEPIFVRKNGEEIFFVREIDGTKKYEAEKLAGYLISNFK